MCACRFTENSCHSVEDTSQICAQVEEYSKLMSKGCHGQRPCRRMVSRSAQTSPQWPRSQMHICKTLERGPSQQLPNKLWDAKEAAKGPCYKHTNPHMRSIPTTICHTHNNPWRTVPIISVTTSTVHGEGWFPACQGHPRNNCHNHNIHGDGQSFLRRDDNKLRLQGRVDHLGHHQLKRALISWTWLFNIHLHLSGTERGITSSAQLSQHAPVPLSLPLSLSQKNSPAEVFNACRM